MKGAQDLRIFLSHSDRNRAAAIKVHDDLLKHGFDVWFSTKRVHAGSWLKEIGVAFLADSSPTATVVRMLRIQESVYL